MDPIPGPNVYGSDDGICVAETNGSTFQSIVSPPSVNFLLLYLVSYPPRYQHLVDKRNPRQAVTPGEGLSKEGKINGFGSIHCFQLIL